MSLVEQHSDIIRLEPPSLSLEFGRYNACVFVPSYYTDDGAAFAAAPG